MIITSPRRSVSRTFADVDGFFLMFSPRTDTLTAAPGGNTCDAIAVGGVGGGGDAATGLALGCSDGPENVWPGVDPGVVGPDVAVETIGPEHAPTRRTTTSDRAISFRMSPAASIICTNGTRHVLSSAGRMVVDALSQSTTVWLCSRRNWAT
jgi:hypothetical protein